MKFQKKNTGNKDKLMSNEIQTIEKIEEGLLYWKTESKGEWIVATYDYVLNKYVGLHNNYVKILDNYSTMINDYNKMLVNARLENLEKKIQ